MAKNKIQAKMGEFIGMSVAVTRANGCTEIFYLATKTLTEMKSEAIRKIKTEYGDNVKISWVTEFTRTAVMRARA